jgi:isocitrate lyase
MIYLEDLKRRNVQDQIDNFETHIVPIIADIDAGWKRRSDLLAN